MKRLLSLIIFLSVSTLILGEAYLVVMRSIGDDSNLKVAGRLSLQLNRSSFQPPRPQVAAATSEIAMPCNVWSNQKEIKTNSIVNYLYAMGVDYSFPYRQRISKLYGFQNYQGTSEQNLKLLTVLKEQPVCLDPLSN